MWRFVTIILLCVVGALASGVPQFLHLREHEREDAREELAAVTAAHENGGGIPQHHEHSEQDCPVCAQFHAPLMTQRAIVWLMETGEWVRYVSMLNVGRWERGVPDRLGCRGPPELSASLG